MKLTVLVCLMSGMVVSEWVMVVSDNLIMVKSAQASGNNIAHLIYFKICYSNNLNLAIRPNGNLIIISCFYLSRPLCNIS